MNTRIQKFGCLALVLPALWVGCGKKKEEPAPTPAVPPAAAPTTPAALPAKGTARITGKVTFEGEAPTPRRIAVSADPVCEELHAEQPLATEDVLVNPNGTLRNVLVYVKTGLEGRTYDTPSEPVLLDQVGCQYTPRVSAVQTRQPLRIRNSDPTLHNVHAMATRNRGFNLGQPTKGMESTRTFSEPEVVVQFKCDVHPWMAAHLAVLEHPFYSVTGEDGTFSLRELPAGDYAIEAWHERYGTQIRMVKLEDGATQEIVFDFKASGL
jgi:hypothetical protein